MVREKRTYPKRIVDAIQDTFFDLSIPATVTVGISRGGYIDILLECESDDLYDIERVISNCIEETPY
ncbi:MAG: hypothetical protein ACRCUJ_08010 [Phocaeicola sp.]